VAGPVTSLAAFGAFELMDDQATAQHDLTFRRSFIRVFFKHIAALLDSKHSVCAMESEHSMRLHEIESCNPQRHPSGLTQMDAQT